MAERIEALRRFHQEPSKCFQRHIREVFDENEVKPRIESLAGAVVSPIDNGAARAVIEKYEWLETMGAATKWCYGLFIGALLVGVACFNKGPQETRNICGENTIETTISLCRGACVPHAPENAGSYLVRNACRSMNRDHGFEVFYAYSDPDAGEVGTIYQAVGWKYLGVGAGREPRLVLDQSNPPRWAWKDAKGRWVGFYHTDFVNEHGERIKTYSIGRKGKYGKPIAAAAEKAGMGIREYVRSLGWKEVMTPDKHKWVWFEGPGKKQLTKACRWEFLPYPKRGQLGTPNSQISRLVGTTLPLQQHGDAPVL